MNFGQMMPLIGMAGGAALAPFTGGMSMLPAMMGAGGALGGAAQGAMGGGGQSMPPPPPTAPPPFQPKGPASADNSLQSMASMMQNRPRNPFGGGGFGGV